MNRTLHSVLAAAVLCLAVACGHASTITFNLAFTGAETGSGTVVADSTTTANQYLATSITGTVNNIPIAALLAPNTYPTGAAANDNLLLYGSTGSATLDFYGISFTDVSGLFHNLYLSSGTYHDLVGTTVAGGTSTALTTLSLTPQVAVTPEPSSLLLLGTGVLSVGGLLKRRMAL